jgi:phosphatidate phosphatase LPIN
MTTKVIKAFIYLWHYNDKIIISDFDGTITKSHLVHGHLMQLIGREYTQDNVIDLFNIIHSNGYKFLYLTARAIGLSDSTRSMLRSINKNGNYLPNGPLLLNPTGLYSAFKEECIDKKPDEFKINCLLIVRSLFLSPKNEQPFHSAFGNKKSDYVAYKALQIPDDDIYIINPDLVIMFAKNYALFEQYFTPIFKNLLTSYSSILSDRDKMLEKFPKIKQS